MYKLPKTAAEAVRLIAQCVFVPFDEADYMGFAGVESEDPKICWLENEDGSAVTVIHDDDNFHFISTEYGVSQLKQSTTDFTFTAEEG